MHTPTSKSAASPAAPLQGRADGELVRQALAGDGAAFEAIVRRHNRLLFRTARSVAPDDGEAQDVVQETYLRAFLNLGAFRGEASLATWLARIAINVALSAGRKKGRLVQLGDGAHGAEPAIAEDTMTLYTPEAQEPSAMADRGEMRALLQACIADLPIAYRTVFMLRAVEELSVEETAFCLDVSQDVVKTRFLRARAMLKDMLSSRIEPDARETFAFAGARCDAVVSHVMAELLRARLIRLH